MEAGPAPDSQAQDREGGRSPSTGAKLLQRHLLSRPAAGHLSGEMLPHDFPPWGTVQYYYRQWRRDGTWEAIQNALRTKVGHKAGRHKSPSAAIIDSQTVKTTRAWEAPAATTLGKRIKGRKRHILVDTLGLLLALVVHSAGIQDPAGAKLVLAKIVGRFPRLRLIWTDGAYQPVVGWAKSFRRLDSGVGPQAEGVADLPGAAPPVEGRADARVAEPLPSSRARTMSTTPGRVRRWFIWR